MCVDFDSLFVFACARHVRAAEYEKLALPLFVSRVGGNVGMGFLFARESRKPGLGPEADLRSWVYSFDDSFRFLVR